MNTVDTGAENKDPKGPADPGVGGNPPAPEEPKLPSAQELAKALDETDLALEKAQGEIVRLKRGEKAADPNVVKQIEDLEHTVEDLKKQNAELIKNGAKANEKTDELSTEITRVRSRNSELIQALVSNETKGKGAGQGSNQAPAAPAAPTTVETDAERSLRERMERRRIAEGRDPKTGLKIRN